MVRVEMPRASWNTVIYILEEYAKQDWPRDPNPMIMATVKEISDQLDQQEY